LAKSKFERQKKRVRVNKRLGRREEKRLTQAREGKWEVKISKNGREAEEVKEMEGEWGRKKRIFIRMF